MKSISWSKRMMSIKHKSREWDNNKVYLRVELEDCNQLPKLLKNQEKVISLYANKMKDWGSRLMAWRVE